MKTCSACRRNLPSESFARNRTTRDALQQWCRECAADAYRRKRQGAGHEVREKVEVPPDHKHCPNCRTVKPHHEWHRSPTQSGGFFSECKTCRAKREREYYFRRVHGMTEADLEVLRRGQDDRCAICWERNPQHVDHDHATGRVRGLLCFRCNVALGHTRDRPALLRRGAAYLEGTAWQPIPSAPGVYPLPS